MVKIPNDASSQPEKRNGVEHARRRVVSLSKVKPMTQDDHRRLRDAASDPLVSVTRRFPQIKT